MCGFGKNTFFNILDNKDDKDIFDLLSVSGASYAQLES